MQDQARRQARFGSLQWQGGHGAEPSAPRGDEGQGQGGGSDRRAQGAVPRAGDRAAGAVWHREGM